MEIFDIDYLLFLWDDFFIKMGLMPFNEGCSSKSDFLSMIEEVKYPGFAAVYKIADLGIKAYIAVHRYGKKTDVAFGATRIWDYPSEEETLNDALGLAELMSHKSALAKLGYGGAKAVISMPKGTSQKLRKNFLKTYAHALNQLNKSFITGADVGVYKEDLDELRTYTQCIVGFHYDPVKFTSIGLYKSVETVLSFLYGNHSIQERSFAIQGLGKVGVEFLKLIYDRAKVIYVTDIDKIRALCIVSDFPKLKLVSPNDIHKIPVDIFVPCALSGLLNQKNANDLMCRAVVGAANNQLSSPVVADLLFQRNIIYAPDYVVNAGGLISVVDEYEHPDVNHQRVSNRVSKISDSLANILDLSQRKSVSTLSIANKKAQSYIDEMMYF